MFLFQAHKVFANLNVLTLTEINQYYLNFFVVNEHFILKSTQQKMPPNFAFLILDSGLVICQICRHYVTHNNFLLHLKNTFENEVNKTRRSK